MVSAGQRVLADFAACRSGSLASNLPLYRRIEVHQPIVKPLVYLYLHAKMMTRACNGDNTALCSNADLTSSSKRVGGLNTRTPS